MTVRILGVCPMRRFLSLCLFPILLAACAPKAISTPTPSVEINPAPVFTPIPSLTPAPTPTATPYASLGTIALDFIGLLCNTEWMNGAQHLTTCPDANADHSGGFATPIDPVPEGLPADTPVMLTIPPWNGYGALFLRYPSFTVGENDRFRATLRCRMSTPCDVQFALEYYDSKGKFHGSFMDWDYITGDPPIQVDAGLSALTGQTVDFVLTLRLFHTLDTPQKDNGLWVAPHIHRPLP